MWNARPFRSPRSTENRPGSEAEEVGRKGGVSPKRTVVRSPAVSRPISGAFDTAAQAAGISSVSVNEPLMSGWSKQGNACDARAGTNSE